MITTIIGLAFAAVVTFGSNVADTFEQTSAPLTWEDAPEAMIELTSDTTDTRYGWVHYVSPEGIEWTKDEPELYRTLNRCSDSDAVYVDVVTGTIYGDQDGNGRLDGDDCNWN